MPEKQIKSVGKWISIIGRYSQMYITRKYQTYGIGHGQLSFLMQLYQQDGVSQDYLAKKLLMDKTTTARAVQKLEKAGFVSRYPDEADRRVNLVFLTDEAKKIHKQIKSNMYEWTEILTRDFSDDEKNLLLDLLKRVADNAVDYINELEGEKHK